MTETVREPVGWRHVWFLARSGEAGLAASDLARPGRVEWPAGPAELGRARCALAAALPGGLGRLVDLSALAWMLLEARAGPAAPSPLPEAGALLGRPWPRAREGRWVPAAVPVLQGGRGGVIWFLVGSVPGPVGGVLPAWARDLVGPDAQGEVAEAFAAARIEAGRTADLVAVPFVAPAWGGVRERSLGLPLALAALSALRGGGPLRGVAATGNVSPDGEVQAVPAGGLEVKARAAAVAGFTLFLFPAACGGGPEVPGLEAAGVGRLDQAWRWAELHARGGPGSVPCLDEALRDGACFAARCRRLSPRVLAWCRDQGLLAPLGLRLARDPDCLGHLAGRVEACLAQEPPDLERAGLLAGLLEGEEAFRAAARASPAAALAWCSAALAAAAGMHQWARASEWARRGEALGAEARRADPDGWMRFRARRMGLAFRPGRRPGPLPRGVAGWIRVRRAVQRLRGGVDPVLGELHEAVGRHLALNGSPAAAARHFEAAARAFGASRLPDWRAAWRRLRGWAALAFLDLGEPAKAREAALDHAGLDAWADLVACGRALRRHVVLRCLLEAPPGPVPPETVAAVERLAESGDEPGLPPRHLWLYAAGRLLRAAGRREAALRALRSSALLCRRFQHPPVGALLPLAELARFGALDAEAAVLLRRAAAGLDPPVPSDPLDLLARIRHDPSRLFPFDTR